MNSKMNTVSIENTKILIELNTENRFDEILPEINMNMLTSA